MGVGIVEHNSLPIKYCINGDLFGFYALPYQEKTGLARSFWTGINPGYYILYHLKTTCYHKNQVPCMIMSLKNIVEYFEKV